MALGQQPKAGKLTTAANTDNAPARRNRIVSFFREVKVELQKTTWPTPKEAWRLTTVVLGVIVAVALYVGVIDFVLSYLTQKFGLIK
jgi:preprotein translocase subunit SecE